ncbi:hypothetical protein TNCV_3593091 [Trichonephila clavipes]|nr:hypothetical protein TNCV_3593091 [Trichonephila clavipes]
MYNVQCTCTDVSACGFETKVTLLVVLFTLVRPSGRVVCDANCCAVGLGLNPGEDMDVCKWIVPSWHGSTLNGRRVASPLVRVVEGEERWEVPDHS